MATAIQISTPSSAQAYGDRLFFDSLVRGYVEDNSRFVRRDWLAQALEEKLAEVGHRFVLLTAEPGAGKSVFMAQLAHDHPDWLRYFIRRDQREVLADVSDRSFLLRIGYQLAALHSELFTQEQLSISVTQSIGIVAKGGEAVGAEVERLIASPFYRRVLQIKQQVQMNVGRLVGLQVKELYVEPRLLTAEDLLNLALINPARALQRVDPAKRIVILVDALDEIRYQPTSENILIWLTNCPDLPENIRFVLSSRPPDEAVKLFCSKQASRLGLLAINEEDVHVKEDIELFAKRLVEEQGLAQRLAQSPGGRGEFVERATDKANGNLGYLDALARGIDQALVSRDSEALQALVSLQELPSTLEGLYDFFLRQIKGALDGQNIVGKDSHGGVYSADVWPAVYDPILGVLAVAAEPVGAETIAELGEIAVDPKWVYPALNRLRQFLDEIDGRYRLYHATMAEFLTGEKTRDSTDPDTAALYQDLLRRHQQIADHYLSPDPMQWHRRIVAYDTKRSDSASIKWREVDDYGLLHLPAHLYALRSIHAYRSHLYNCVSRPAMIAKWLRFGSLVSFGNDLKIGMSCASQEDPVNWVDFMRCYLINRSLSSCNLSADVFSFLASAATHDREAVDALSFFDQALGILSNIREIGTRAESLGTVARFLFRAGFTDRAKKVLNQAIAETQTIQNVQHRSQTLRSIVLNMGLAGDLEHAREIAQEALVNAESETFAWAKAISVSSLAFVFSQLGEQALAEKAFSIALSAAWNVPDNDDRAYALLAVASAMKQAGDQGAEDVFRDAGAQFYAMGMPPDDIEDEFKSMHIDYRAESGWDIESLFSLALDVSNANDRLRAIDKVAESISKALLCGMYPSKSRGEIDVDRLCDRSLFRAIVSEEEHCLLAQGKTSLLLRLYNAIQGGSE